MDINHLTKTNFLVRSSESITDKGVQYVSGATLPLVVKYRDEKRNVLLSEISAERKHSLDVLKKDNSGTRGGGNGIITAGKQIICFLKSAGQHDDRNVYEMLHKDPLIFMAAAASDFAHNYSPFHAKKFMSKKQGNPFFQKPQQEGTAFVLPLGYVVNKSVGMDDQDLETLTFKEAPDSDKITPRCATSPFVTRTNIFGYENSARNSLALINGTTEVLVCPCSDHASLLEAPDKDSFSKDPTTIEFVEEEKEYRFPTPGLSAIRNRQVTTQRHASTDKPNTQEKDSVPAVNDDVETRTVPVYGTNLVVLPDQNFTLALNCPCTGRKDGTYSVGKEPGGLLYRDVMGYFNANPVHTLHASRDNKNAWIATGKSITSITCEGELMKAIQ